MSNVVELAVHERYRDPREITPEQWHRYERHLAEILAALGMDLDTPGTRETPRRLLQALFDATAGYDGDPKLHTAFPSERPAGVDGDHSQIMEGPIAFHALCEHHALPFHGTAHVAYIPDEEILGISKLTRLVRLHARRFTVQERLGEQIADTLRELVGARGVAVHLQAAHLCTQMRGVAEDGSRTVTTFWRGLYEHDPDLRRDSSARRGAGGRHRKPLAGLPRRDPLEAIPDPEGGPVRIAIALLVMAAALALPVTALAGAQHAKFDFDGVIFPDGTTGTIYVGSKQTGGGSQFTNCGYEASDGTFLGNYGDSTFSSTDADTLKQFCLDHFADRS